MKKYRNFIPVIVIVLLAVLSFLIIKPFFIAIFIGALLAYIFYPLYSLLQKKMGSRILPALLICLIVTLLVLIPGGFFIKSLVEQSYSVFILAKEKVSLGVFETCTHQICIYVQELAKNPNFGPQIQELVKSVTDWIIQKGSAILIGVPIVLVNLFITLFTLFYFQIDGDKFVKNLQIFLRMKKRKYQVVVKRLDEIVHGLVFGYIIVALIQGILGALGFFLFGVPSPLFWGLIMALLALIPYLGTGIIWVPASLYLFFSGVIRDSDSLILKGVGLFAYGLLIVSSIDNILKPKMMGERAKTHPALIMIGIFGGIALFGPLGVIIGPLILALTMVFFEIYLLKD